MLELSDSESLIELKEQLKTTSTILIDKTWDTATASILSYLLTATKKNILIISEKTQNSSIFNDLSTLSSNEILEFPAWDTLLEEKIPPSPDVIGRRMEVLTALCNKEDKNFAVITSMQGALQKTIEKELLPFFIPEWAQKTKFIF